ncbi:hypothetical protein LN42_00575 [Marinitoga sp. 1137]|uniref:head-tail connector protein n=1 Tax=Marinitoga sp. 1137 TaxID=1545835 RepID=UPI0009507781|nr:head-tail connector protein [Marinitoga sp. 1137]APT75055.1 hypothetical protein LN42_00575 [Marinitoga sp. 1137]
MLISLTELKTYLRIEDTNEDTRLNQILNAVDVKVKKYCKRKFEYGEFTETVYFSDGVGLVKETPLENVIEAKDLYDTNYDIFRIESKGTIYLDTKFTGYLDVKYTGGYSSIPDDLKFAVMRYCEYLYNKPEGIKSQSFEGMNINFDIPNDVFEILDMYKVIRM